MRLHRVGAAVCAVAVVVSVGGCSSSGSNDGGGKPGKPERTASAEPSETEAGKLSDTWGPRLDKLPGTDAVAACNDVASVECGARVLEVREGLVGLSEALDEAGGYPKTSKELAGVLESWSVWQADGCAGAGGERCYAAALAVAMAPAGLRMTLATDEYNAS